MDILENNKLFNKIGLIDSFNLELNSKLDDFRDRFKGNVIDIQDSYGMTRPKNEFQGKIKRDTFTISRTFSAFESDPVGASGTYSENGDKILINVYVYLPLWTFIIIYSLLLFIDFISIYFFTTSGPSKNILSIMIFGTAITSFTILWPFILTRRNIRKLKNDLEKEFHYWYR